MHENMSHEIFQNVTFAKINPWACENFYHTIYIPLKFFFFCIDATDDITKSFFFCIDATDDITNHLNFEVSTLKQTVKNLQNQIDDLKEVVEVLRSTSKKNNGKENKIVVPNEVQVYIVHYNTPFHHLHKCTLSGAQMNKYFTHALSSPMEEAVKCTSSFENKGTKCVVIYKIFVL